MFITTPGIVLRTYPFRDNKLIVKIFTKDAGILSFIITKTKSQIALSQLLTIAEITYKHSKNQSLFYIKEVNVNYIYKSLTTDGEKIQVSLILCEILNKCLNEQNSLLYDFIINYFKTLDGLKSYVVGFDTLFLIKFCKIIGISPFENELKDITNMVLSIEEGGFIKNRECSKENLIVPAKDSLEIYKLSRLDFGELKESVIDSSLNERLFNYMINYLSIHLTDLRSLKSLEVVNDLI